ncbi:OmpH family outer membrane protein [Malonomonas rubra]|uniref:OmpH family outer membrane protein n=1 Tax=Malonomonas rubra TaxID=57040 RepID=UPI0026E99F9A|nr:OmpH family outer membrane protein [Malonomonas rubra]
MKKMMVLACVLSFLLCASVAVAAEMKIGYVDLQKALNMSSSGKAAKEKMKAKFKDYDADVQKKQDELKKLKDDLEKQAMLLSTEARAAKERDYQQKVKDYQRMTKDIQEELQQADQDYTRKILEEIFKVVQSLSKQEGYTLVLEKTESSILYASDSIDLTDRVIQTYDKQSGK